MGSLKYLVKRVKGMNFKNMFDTAKEVGKKTGKNSFFTLIDIMYCGYKYLAGYVDYKVFKMYDLNKEQRSTYITRGINNNYVKLLNDSEEMKKIDNKLYFNKSYNQFIKRDWICLDECTKEDFSDFVNEHKIIIAKPVDGMCGKGVIKVKINENSNIEELYNRLKNEDQILVEECIVQHKELAKFNPTSVNTLRVVTLKKAHEVVILFVGLRIGNGKDVDNFNSGGMFTTIDMDGVVRKPAVDKQGETYTIHPITKEEIIGFKIPKFEEALNIAKECAASISKVNYIGFDIVVTPNDVLVLEANPFPGHDLYQSVPHLEKDLKGLKPRFDKEIYNK